jgi:3-oxochol-4-en-24-oyl-CoA dehydrogenase
VADSNDILTMLRDSAMGYLGDNASAPAGGIAIDAPQAVDRDRWREIAELGWLGLGIPESQGGSGLNVMAACVLAEQFGVYASRLPYVACAVMPAKILEHCADHAETAALIERLICGDGLITLAWQEAVNTLDTQPVQTRLENNVITGRKLFVPAAADDSLLLVSVSTSDGPAIAVVEASAPGVHREIFASSGAALAHIRFDQTPLYRGAPLRVGEPATQALQQAVDAGRIAISAQLAGTASGCLEKTLQYLRDREQFGKPLANFQALRHRAVDMSMAARLAGASWRNAAKTFDESSDSQATQHRQPSVPRKRAAAKRHCRSQRNPYRCTARWDSPRTPASALTTAQPCSPMAGSAMHHCFAVIFCRHINH